MMPSLLTSSVVGSWLGSTSPSSSRGRIYIRTFDKTYNPTPKLSPSIAHPAQELLCPQRSAIGTDTLAVWRACDRCSAVQLDLLGGGVGPLNTYLVGGVVDAWGGGGFKAQFMCVGQIQHVWVRVSIHRLCHTSTVSRGAPQQTVIYKLHDKQPNW